MCDITNYRPDKNFLKDRVILVTGAGQGIGRVAALEYAAYGATVILHGRKIDKLESVYDEIESKGGAKAVIFPFDLEKVNGKDFEVIVQAIRSQLGRLDGILHNAAFIPNLTPLENQTFEQWLTILRINLVAPISLTRACLPLLKASPDACVIMTSDIHGHFPTAYWGGFAVAKAGIEALVKIQAQEWEIYKNLRINVLIPGTAHTPQRTKTHPGEIKKNLIHPKELMSAYLYLMGPASKGVTGKILFCQEHE
ncbi:MAG: NAD(P)-dependent oxidoreductase [Nitrosomonadaceae bacterium]|nr:NAD(P)-dependent oxidoreductase [Rickettsiales bacterium]MBL79760.1 NAD(P)-dependent oxidoreductase [Nitrosomonadaceae bacterium]|tara:strand:- start:49 stop:807 length:759 start_codon:yes stop_codon:yes gene_type:complete